MNWTEIRYRIADRLFEAELDEAFALGVKEGKRRQASIIRIKMEHKKTIAKQSGLTKAQEVGWDRCIQGVENAIR